MRYWVDVLGVRVNVVTEDDVLRYVEDRIAAKQPAHVATVNVEYVMRARTDPLFADVLRRCDLATPDSFGVVWAMRRRHARVPRRVGGADLIWSLCEQAARRSHRVFLLGAAPGVAEAAATRLRQQYPGLIVAGAYGGSPADHERAYIVDLVRQRRADLLFVAFGAPQQDLWIAGNLAATGAQVAMGVGGSLDYVAGTARRAPGWMRERGIEWLWRLTSQPWRWRRMLVLPKFVWYILRTPAVGRAGEKERE